MADHVFVAWEEDVSEFDHFRYSGDGVFRPGKKQVVLHYSSVVNDKIVEDAKAYAAKMPEHRTRVRVFVTNWENRHHV